MDLDIKVIWTNHSTVFVTPFMRQLLRCDWSEYRGQMLCSDWSECLYKQINSQQLLSCQSASHLKEPAK